MLSRRILQRKRKSRRKLSAMCGIDFGCRSFFFYWSLFRSTVICIIWSVLWQFPSWDCNPLPVCGQSSVTAALLSVINQWSYVCHPALPGSNDHDSTQYLFSKYPTFTLSTAISLALNPPHKRQYNALALPNSKIRAKKMKKSKNNPRKYLGTGVNCSLKSYIRSL